MRVPHLRLTVERVMIALVFVIAGSLLVGSISDITARAAQIDAFVFGVSYSAEVGLIVIVAARYLRESPRRRLKPSLGAMAMIVVMAWATIEWPVVQGWAYHATCERLYRSGPDIAHDAAIRQKSLLLHSGLRRAYQQAVFRPWKTPAPP